MKRNFLQVFSLSLAGSCLLLIFVLLAGPVQAQGPDEFYGVHVGREANVSASLPGLRDMGVRWVRVFADINSWSSPGTSSAFQQAIDFKAAGFKVILELNALNGIQPADYNQAKAYWQWVVAQNGLKNAVDVWEILNELNLPKYWTGTPEKYVNEVLKSAWDVLHVTNGEPVLAGSFTAGQGTFGGTDVTAAYVNAGYLNYCDYAGIHPYLESVSATRSFMDAVLALYGSKPLILSEWNFKTGTPTTGSATAWVSNLNQVRDYLYSKPTVKIVCHYRQLQTSSEGGWPGLQWSGEGYPPHVPFYNMYKSWPKTASRSNAPPSGLVITSPANGATFNQGATITFTATGSDIASVQFFVDGNTPVGTDASSSSGWSLSTAAVPPGRHQVSVVAYDSQGARVGAYGPEIFVNSTSTGKVVSLNFVGSATGLTSTSAAGVVSRPNWSNTTNATFTRGLTDENGANTGVTVQNNLPSNYAGTTAATSGDKTMMKGYVASFNTNQTNSVIVSDLPPAVTANGYDVYVYWGNTYSGTTATIATAYILNGVTYYLKQNSNEWNGAYARSTATTETAAVAGPNYVRFTGQTAASFTLNVKTTGTARGGISGLQIVNSSVAPSLGTVQMTSPAAGTTVTEGSAVTLSATTSGFGSTISNVKFYYNGTNLIDTDNTISGSTWSVSTTSLPAGNLAITAVATISSGGTTGSVPVALKVASAQAERTLSVNFVGTGSELLSTDLAGVVPVTNWNNAVNNASTAGLKLGNGSTTSAAVGNTIPSNYNSGDGTGTGDYKLMRGYIGRFDQNPGSVTVSGLPASLTSGGYKVYVYWGNRSGAVDGSVAYTLGSTTYYLRDNTSTWNGTHVRSTATSLSAATTGASYVLFENLSGSSFTLSVRAATGGDFRGGISGLQIVGNATGPQTLPALADTYVNEQSPSSTYGTLTTMQLRNSAGYRRQMYLKFDLTNISSAPSAKLRLYGSYQAAKSVAVKPVTDLAWTESSLTWNNKPVPGAQIASASIGTTVQYYEWDLTAFVQANYGKVVGLYLETVGETNYTGTFNSKENTGNKPQLVIGSSSARLGNAASPEAPEAVMVLYPNPARDVFRIRYHVTAATTARLELLDLAGKAVVRREADLEPGWNEVPCPAAGIRPGIYQVKVSTPGGVSVQKLLITR